MIDDPKIHGQELENEVLELTLAWQQGVADAEERARLEYLLADSAEARRLYASIASDTVSLSELAEAAAGVDSQAAPAPASAAGRGASILRASLFGPSAVWNSSLTAVAAAALVAVVLWGANNWPTSGGVPASAPTVRPLARIVN
jgi:hypothetical protein